MPGVIIAGTNSGAGKTTISMGIMSVLSEKYTVQPFKVGPDYIDPAFHSYITNRHCRNLDSFMIKDELIKYLYVENCKDADISIIEGVMGLYDGAEIGSDVGSTARIAKILKLPVVLVVDGKGISQSVAAIVKGYADFDKEVSIKGVIFNNLSSEKHYLLLKEAVEMYTNVKPLGFLKKNPDIKMPERHLGLVPAVENGTLSKMIGKLSEMIHETVDIDGLMALANNITIPSSTYIPITKNYDLTIAVAYDKAFNFYYQDNLDLLKKWGVKIIKFSPLKDSMLPKGIDAVIFGGGFPEVFAKELSKNKSMLTDINSKLCDGLPYVAECGGLMYLCKTITDLNNKTHNMVGFFNGNSYMTKRLQHFGYAELTPTEECIYCTDKSSIKVHEFHRSRVEMTKEKSIFKLKKERKDKALIEWQCGFYKNNGIASYAHLHYYANLTYPQKMLEFIREHKGCK